MALEFAPDGKSFAAGRFDGSLAIIHGVHAQRGDDSTLRG